VGFRSLASAIAITEARECNSSLRGCDAHLRRAVKRLSGMRHSLFARTGPTCGIFGDLPLTSRGSLCARLKVAFCLLFIGSELSSVVCAQSAGAVTVEEIRQSLVEYERSLSTFSATYSVKGTVRDPLHMSAVYPASSHETYTRDRAGRVRFDFEGQLFKTDNGKPTIRPWKSLNAYDGTYYTSLRGHNDQTSGMIEKSRTPLGGWTVEPTELTTNMVGKPISNLIGKLKAKITGRCKHDGNACIVLEGEPVFNDGNGWKCRFIVDPAFGFAVVRRSQEIQLDGKGDWIEFRFVDCHD